MKRHCDIEDMEYASAWQKAYGVSYDELLALARRQERLARFDELPTCDHVDESLAGRCHELVAEALPSSATKAGALWAATARTREKIRALLLPARRQP